MAGKIWEFFGYRSDDHSPAAVAAATDKQCPYLSEVCEKRLSDGAIAGVCTIKPATSGPVICCPIRLYADKYRALYDVAKIAFDDDLELIAGRQASARARAKGIDGRPYDDGTGHFALERIEGKIEPYLKKPLPGQKSAADAERINAAEAKRARKAARMRKQFGGPDAV